MSPFKIQNASNEMRWKINKLFRRRSNFILVCICLTIIIYVSGILLHPFEIDFEENFNYPLEIENLRDVIEILETGREKPPNFPRPINEYKYRFVIVNKDKCKIKKNESNVFLLLVIKSALENAKRRKTVRETWGFEQRFSDVNIKRIFLVGSCQGRHDINDCQNTIDDESHAYQDIIQADFTDSYYNNTIKTMMGFKWVINHCQNAEFVLFIDDDYYLSMKNLLKFLRNPLAFPIDNNDNSNSLAAVSGFDGRLLSGYVFPESSPMRHRTSKWFVSLEEYPYSKYPPYVTAGAFVMSMNALSNLYYASLFTKHFRFDDIYIAILARKISLSPIHNDNFYFWNLNYSPETYANVIAAHGFDNSQRLYKIWLEQKSSGNA